MSDTSHTIVLLGSPSWSVTPPPGFTLKHYPDTTQTVRRITDDRAVLILVDGDGPDWGHFTSAPKASNATRRVPLIVVSTDAAIRDAAPGFGADLTLSPDDLATTDLTTLAAIRDDAATSALASGCNEPLPTLAQEGVRKFNNREFYPQHDLFEEQWVNTEGPIRDLYRAILQVGVAYYQIERGNYNGARKMLLRAVQWLNPLPDVCQTVNIAKLRADAAHVREVLEATDPADIADFDHELLKPLELVDA
ncbi:MAG: DUF309 domain-containing protein [Chloroflexota bacterium]